jgi:hypothetical protein
VNLKRHAGSIVFFVLAPVVGVLIFLDRGTVSDSERKERQHDVFPAYRRGDIDWIELEQGGAKLRIDRRPDTGDAGETHWQMTAPVDERADPAAVDRLIGDLEFAGAIRRVDPAKAPDVDKSFVAPRVRGTLSMKPLVYHFALAGAAPVPEGAAYFRVDGEGTFVVSKDFATSLLNTADTYRERVVVPYLSLDLARLTIDGPGGQVGVSRVDDISFKLLASGLRASRDGMDKVWGALAEARAESFPSEADAQGAIGVAPVRVTMNPKDERRPEGVLVLGGPCPGHADDVVLLRSAPTREAACVPRGAKEGLSAPEASLVDHRLFAARADEVAEITLEAVPAGVTVELARSGHGWHQRKPRDRDLAADEVDRMNDLVTRLTRGEALTVEKSVAPADDHPRARVRIRRSSTEVEEVVEVLPEANIVRRTFDGALLRIPNALARRLVPTEIALRGRSVFGDKVDARGATALETRCDGVHQSLTRAHEEWTMVEPRGYRADTLATADLVGLVKNAQADSWIADKDDGTFGFAESSCSVSLALPADGSKTTLGLVFGKEAEGGLYYAHASDDAAIFLASRALRDGASLWLVDRGGFRADPREIRDVTLSRGPAHVVFRAGNGGGDAGGRDPAARVFEALDVLRPELVVHLGAAKPGEGFTPPTLDVRVRVGGDSGARELHFVLGNTALLNRERVVFARVDGTDATFGVSREHVEALIGAL